MLWIKIALKNVLKNGRRSLITILIAGVGIASLLIGAGFGLFTYESLREASAKDTGYLTLSHKNFFEPVAEEVTLEFGLEDYQSIEDKLLVDSRITDILPRIWFDGLISNGDKSKIFSGIGIITEEFAIQGPFLEVKQGKTLSYHQSADQTPEVMLGEHLASSLNVDIGSELTLMTTTVHGAMNALDVKVCGVFSVGIPELDKRLIYTHLDTAQELMDTDKVSFLSLYLEEINQTQTLKDELEKEFPDYALTPWWERAFYYKGAKALYDRIFSILGIIIGLLVFFSVSNTMSMAVLERTREIGTCRAMGSFPAEIVRNFVLEAMIIALAASILGISVAAFTSNILYVIDFQMPPPPGRSQGYPLYIYFSPLLAACSSLILMFICISAAFWASIKSARKPISEALIHV